MKRKIILLTEIISPYRIPVFNEIAQILQDRFLVLFLGETEKRRQWKIYKEEIKFDYGVLPHLLCQRKNSSPYFFNPTIFYKLIKCSPQVIIAGGYQHPSYFFVLLYAKLFKRKIILWCESNKYDRRRRYPLIENYKRWFVQNCQGYIVPGRASLEYVISLGADVRRVWMAPDAVDNDYFARESQRHKQNTEAIKKAKKYPQKLLLYVGRMIDQKGVLDLVQAFCNLSKRHVELGLVLVGSGPQAARYQRFCKQNKIENVFFAGFVHREELSLYYAVSDMFILPSRSEPWGLALNEAMASKLPVIASDVAGAAEDLIVNGENGYTYRNGNITELSEVIEKVLNSNRQVMGMKSYEIIQNFSPQKCAQGFIRAITEI